MTSNYSIYSIPLYWLITLWPHAYATEQIKKANNKQWNNANPRGIDTIESYKKKVPADVFKRYERAEAAHKNCLENAPLFIGAVIVGNMVGLDASTLNMATGAYLASRVAYNALYINITERKASFIRSGFWAIGIAILFGIFIKAGNKIASN